MEIEDLTSVEQLTEDVFIDVLEKRYLEDAIYTNVGDVLVAMNPFRMLPMYGAEESSMYSNVQREGKKLPPHVFATSDRAYAALMRDLVSQVCVISGESGAGKTESAKLFVRQVITLASGGDMSDSKEDNPNSIEGKIMSVNPVLEAFGNAATVMNRNSSRFGKYMELKVSNVGAVRGASITHYLLEKSRVVAQASGESNYHIFGYIVGGLDPEVAKELGIAGGDFTYLGSIPKGAEDPVAAWKEVEESMKCIGFSNGRRGDILRILAGILHLGNVRFDPGDNDGSTVRDPNTLEEVCDLLTVEPAVLLEALTVITTEIMGETYQKPAPPEKCNDFRDATAKALYNNMFTWIVQNCDLMLQPMSDPIEKSGAESNLGIGVLDIFGFENFKRNGFEQLCINLANEQLQYFFNQTIFASELAEYAMEGLDILDLGFIDNRELLDTFYRKSAGLLGLLDETARFATSTDDGFVDKLNTSLASSTGFVKLKGRGQFGIQHFAGLITYTADGFLERNRDPLPEKVVEALMGSNNDLVRHLFGPNFGKPMTAKSRGGGGGRRASGFRASVAQLNTRLKSRRLSRAASRKSRRGSVVPPSMAKGARGGKKGSKGGGKTSVAQQFKVSLMTLVERMEQCAPHFVRCIKPNGDSRPHEVDCEYVKKQLRYSGMMETTRIRSEGYAHRVSFFNFFDRFRGIKFLFSDSKVKANKANCIEILHAAQTQLTAMGVQPLVPGRDLLDSWKVGKSKVFLRFWHMDPLTQLTALFTPSAVCIQKWVRRYLARQIYLRKVHELRRVEEEKKNFFYHLTTLGGFVYDTLLTLEDEDERREGFDGKPGKKKRTKTVKTHGNQKKLNKEIDKARSKAAKWWCKNERSKGVHTDSEKRLWPWFHGLISRAQAEELLIGTEEGTFLVRVSERTLGYAVSFRYANRCRHYKLGFGHEGAYEIIGMDQKFNNLEDLVEYYQAIPLTAKDNDLLDEPLECERDLGLGITDELKGDVDPMAKPGSFTPLGDDVQRRPGGKGRMRKAASVVSLLITDEDRMGTPMSEEFFLREPMYKAGYMRSAISRQEAESALRGWPDGTFLVREKVLGEKRVVFALSFVFFDEFKHHLLEKQKSVSGWFLDNQPLDDEYEFLEDCINGFMKVRDVGLACKLTHGLLPQESGNPPHKKGQLPPPPADGSAGIGRRRSLPMTPEFALSGQVKPGAWDVNIVTIWLRGAGLATHVSSFKHNEVTGNKLLGLDKKGIAKIVKGKKDRAAVAAAIERLKSGNLSDLARAVKDENQGTIKSNSSQITVGTELGDDTRQRKFPPPALPHGGVIAGPAVLPGLSSAVPPLAAPKHRGGGGGKKSKGPAVLPGLALPSLPSLEGDIAGVKSLAPVPAAANNRAQMRQRRIPHEFYDPPKRGAAKMPEAKLAKLAKSGNLKDLKRFLAAYPDLNVDRIKRRGDWKTPLFLAAEYGHDRVVVLLLDAGANPMLRSSAGLTPLNAALRQQRTKCITILENEMDRIERLPVADLPPPPPRHEQGIGSALLKAQPGHTGTTGSTGPGSAYEDRESAFSNRKPNLPKLQIPANTGYEGGAGQDMYLSPGTGPDHAHDPAYVAASAAAKSPSQARKDAPTPMALPSPKPPPKVFGMFGHDEDMATEAAGVADPELMRRDSEGMYIENTSVNIPTEQRKQRLTQMHNLGSPSLPSGLPNLDSIELPVPPPRSHDGTMGGDDGGNAGGHSSPPAPSLPPGSGDSGYAANQEELYLDMGLGA